MPVIWQSSQRPMYVRTVFVDGFRHAILNNDDPHYLKIKAKRRPHSSISYNNKPRSREPRLSHREEELAGCLRKLNLVITSDKSIPPRPKTAVYEPAVERLDLKDIDQDSDEELVLKSKPQRLYEFESFRAKFNSLCHDMKSLRSNRTARAETREGTDLSDRVLQWLDLAGKIDLLAPESESRMAQPRHSWPDVKRGNLVKSKTTVDLKRTDKVESPKEVANENSERADIDRAEYAPAPANTIENYARLTRNKNTPCRYKPRDHVKTRKEMKRNVQETRQKIETERNAVEKQYAELVSRKILPEYVKSKKQVHIFIPELAPKKTGSLISGVSKGQ